MSEKKDNKKVKIGCCVEFSQAFSDGSLFVDEDNGKLYISGEMTEGPVYYCPFCGFKLIYV